METHSEPPPEAEEPTFAPPAVRYRTLSLVWCFPTLGALWLVGTGMQRWNFGQGILKGLERIRVEEWIAFLLIGLHAFLLVQWWRTTKDR